MFRRSGHRFADKNMRRSMTLSMIPKKPAPEAAGDAIRGGNRFPACAKPAALSVVWLDASAGEGRSEKIMLKRKA
jgi:hypothetical protein